MMETEDGGWEALYHPCMSAQRNLRHVTPRPGLLSIPGLEEGLPFLPFIKISSNCLTASLIVPLGPWKECDCGVSFLSRFCADTAPALLSAAS